MTTGLLITTAGQAAIAADLGGGADLVLTHVAWGDASGVPYAPVEAQTALVNERYRATIASVAVVSGQIIVDAVIPADTADALARPSHGFNVAECGLFNAAGTLIGIAAMGNGFKPSPASGQASVATYRLSLAVANPSAISVVIDPQAQMSIGRNVRPFWVTVDGVLNNPPGAPVTGATYVIGDVPTGAWAGFAGRMAQWIGVWALATAPEGHVVCDSSAALVSLSRYLRREGAAWVSATMTGTAVGFADPAFVRSQRLNFASAANVGGTVNATGLAFTPAFTSLAAMIGTPLIHVAEISNTGPMTVTVSGLAATPRTWPDGTPLAAGDYIAGDLIIEYYDGLAFRLQKCLSPAQVKATALKRTSTSYLTAGAYTYTVPAATYLLSLEGVASGAGGGGAAFGSPPGAASGAGAGASGTRALVVLPGDTLDITIPPGGSAGTAGANGGNGANLTVVHKRLGATLETLTLAGGTGSLACAAGVAGNSAAPGSSGTGWDQLFTGEPGEGGKIIGSVAVGGKGGGARTVSISGLGGQAGIGNANPGNGPGGGGGGGGGLSGSNTNGGAGAAGGLKITV